MDDAPLEHTGPPYCPFVAAEQVRRRMRRAARGLRTAGVPYAVVGGHAVEVWVASVDEGGVRNTPDVDILIRRGDLPAAAAALETVGFIRRTVDAISTFQDTSSASPRAVVELLFAGERVRPTDPFPAPDVSASVVAPLGHRVVALDALVLMKLTAYRDKDRTHLRDMISVGLIDATWPARLRPPLGDRLQAVLDDPDG